MKLAIGLSPSQADRFHERAKSLGLPQPEERVRAALPDLLTTSEEGLQDAADVLTASSSE